MNTSISAAAIRFAAAYSALTAAHEVGDYLIQRDSDAAAKGMHGQEGVAACLRHVCSYTATQALALYAADRYLRLGLNWRRATVGLAVSAVTHYAADRCAGHWADDSDAAPLLVRAAHTAGKGSWLVRDPRAGAFLDQAWHKGWIGLAAAITAGRTHD
ncbi:hypothetical protein AB0A05_07555 [Streptomyces sp. NPDC046374]|uniref:hypothetical protein n=1 Tax=Streptomyces sp. NPDC046374 TaxID=3154917 RepID=UPI0033CB46A7